MVYLKNKVRELVRGLCGGLVRGACADFVGGLCGVLGGCAGVVRGASYPAHLETRILENPAVVNETHIFLCNLQVTISFCMEYAP